MTRLRRRDGVYGTTESMAFHGPEWTYSPKTTMRSRAQMAWNESEGAVHVVYYGVPDVEWQNLGTRVGEVVEPLAAARAIAPTSETEDAPDQVPSTAEAPSGGAEVTKYIDRHGLYEALAICQNLLRESFGPEGRLRGRLREDLETGETNLVLEAHYGYEADDVDVDELFQRHERFLRDYISKVPGEARQVMTLTWVATNGNHA